MTCESIQLPDGTIAIVCSRGKRGPKAPCGWCTATHERLCDAPVGTRGRTCSKRLCATHANQDGERDLCPEHAPLETEAPHALRVFTSRIWLRDPDCFDITRGNGGPAAEPFAPSKAILMPALAARMRATELLGRGEEAEASGVIGHAWAKYAPAYRAEMRRSYREHRAAWDALLARERVVLTCYCALDPRLSPVDQLARGQCHRVLLAGYLAACGAVYCGEIALPRAKKARAA